MPSGRRPPAVQPGIGPAHRSLSPGYGQGPRPRPAPRPRAARRAPWDEPGLLLRLGQVGAPGGHRRGLSGGTSIAAQGSAAQPAVSLPSARSDPGEPPARPASGTAGAEVPPVSMLGAKSGSPRCTRAAIGPAPVSESGKIDRSRGPVPKSRLFPINWTKRRSWAHFDPPAPLGSLRSRGERRHGGTVHGVDRCFGEIALFALPPGVGRIGLNARKHHRSPGSGRTGLQFTSGSSA